MECINPKCKEADDVKALFADSKGDKELSCPYCRKPLQRTSAIKKPKEEAAVSRANDESTAQNEGTSSEAASPTITKSEDDQPTGKNKDEGRKPQRVITVIVSQRVIEGKVQYVTGVNDATNLEEQESDIVKELRQQSECVSGPGTSTDQGFHARSNTSSCLESSEEKNILDHGDSDLSEEFKSNNTNISGQSIETIKNKQYQSNDQKPNGIKDEFPKGSSGIACAFENANNSLPASSSGGPDQDSKLTSGCSQLERKQSQTKDQTSVDEDDDTYSEAISKDKEESMDPEKNTDQRCVSDREEDSKLQDDPEEDNNQSDFNSNDDQESEYEEETKALDQQNRGQPLPYGKDEIRQKKKERKNKRKQGSKNTPRKKAKKDEDNAQAKKVDKGQERQKQDKIPSNRETTEGGRSSLNEGESYQRQQTIHVNNVTVTTTTPPLSVTPTNEESVTNEGSSSSPLEQRESDRQKQTTTITTPLSVTPMNEESVTNEGSRSSPLEQRESDRQQQTTTITTRLSVTPMNEESVTNEGSRSSPLEQRIPDEQQRQKAPVEPNKHITLATPSFANTMDENCVTIVFHALLSPDFDFEEKKYKITIRAGHPELGSWHCDRVDMIPISKTEEKFVHVRGVMLLPVRLLFSRIPYKYVIRLAKDNQEKPEDKWEWEYSEFADRITGVIVNRSLVIFKEVKGAIWHQYDGVIYSEPPKDNSSWKFWKWWGKNGFNPAEVLKNRKHAAKTFLPRWKGFITSNAECELMLATEALEQVYAIADCLTHVCLSTEGCAIIIDLEFKKILADFLKPKLEYNAKLSKKDLESSEVRVDRLVSSLAITHLIALYNLDLTYFELKNILNCLVIRANHTGGCDFDEIHKHFPEEMWRDLVDSILRLTTSANSKHAGFCPDIILAVPLIHFLRKELIPFEEPEVTHPTTIKEWCRADGLMQYKTYSGFVESFLPKALPMFPLDPLLRRLFLHHTL